MGGTVALIRVSVGWCIFHKGVSVLRRIGGKSRGALPKAEIVKQRIARNRGALP